MSMYHNSDTSGPISCPYCGMADDECPHLLAVLDQSNATCDGGALYAEWDDLVVLLEDAFRPILENHEQPPAHWQDEINELWEEARSGWNGNPDDVWIDPYVMMRLVIDLLVRTDAIIEDNGSMDDVMARSDFVTDLVYSKDPERTLEQVRRILQEWITGQTQ